MINSDADAFKSWARQVDSDYESRRRKDITKSVYFTNKMTPTTSFSGLDASGPSQTEEMAVSKPLVKEWHASLNPNLRNHVVDKL